MPTKREDWLLHNNLQCFCSTSTRKRSQCSWPLTLKAKEKSDWVAAQLQALKVLCQSAIPVFVCQLLTRRRPDLLVGEDFSAWASAFR